MRNSRDETAWRDWAALMTEEFHRLEDKYCELKAELNQLKVKDAGDDATTYTRMESLEAQMEKIEKRMDQLYNILNKFKAKLSKVENLRKSNKETISMVVKIWLGVLSAAVGGIGIIVAIVVGG